MQSVVGPVSQQGNSPPVETRITRDCAALATHWAASACCCVACVPLKIIDVVKSPLWDVLSCSDSSSPSPRVGGLCGFLGPALRTHRNVTCPGSGRQAGSPTAASHPCRQLATSSCWWAAIRAGCHLSPQLVGLRSSKGLSSMSGSRTFQQLLLLFLAAAGCAVGALELQPAPFSNSTVISSELLMVPASSRRLMASSQAEAATGRYVIIRNPQMPGAPGLPGPAVPDMLPGADHLSEP